MMHYFIPLLVFSALFYSCHSIILDEEANEIIFKLLEEFTNDPTNERFSHVIKFTGADALKVSKVLIWCPVQHFNLDPIICPFHGCPMKAGKWNRFGGSGRKHLMRLIYDFSGNIILIQCQYECSQKHSFTSASSEILELLPRHVQNRFPVQMHYLTAFTTQLYSFIISGAQQRQSFKKMSEAIASLNLRQFLHHCSTNPEADVTQEELIERFSNNQMFSFPNNAKLMHVFLHYYSEVNMVLHQDMGEKTGKVLTCDNSFKFINKRIGVIRPKDGIDAQMYEGLFMATNEENEIVFWRLSDTSATTDEMQELLRDYNERLALRGETLSMAVVDDCCEVRSLYESIFGSDIKVKLNIQQVQDHVFSTLKKGTHNTDMVADFTMLFRAEGDHGVDRHQPTPSIEEIVSNLDGFLTRWDDKLKVGTRSAISVIRGHVLQGCLSGIPPKCGTEYNEELQEHVSKGFLSNVTTLSPELAIAVLAFTLFAWNSRKKYWSQLNGILSSHLQAVFPPELLQLVADRENTFDASSVDTSRISGIENREGLIQSGNISHYLTDSTVIHIISRILHLHEFHQFMQKKCISHGFNILEFLYLDKIFFLLRTAEFSDNDEVSKNRVVLEKNLSAYGLKIDNVIGDGNCCFRSIVTQVKKITSVTENSAYTEFVKSLGLCSTIDDDAQCLRALFVKEISSNMEKYQRWISLSEERLNEELAKFTENGFYEGDLGDFCVKVCSDILQIPIVVVTSYDNAPQVPFVPETATLREPIILAFDHTAPGHYDATTEHVLKKVKTKSETFMCSCGKNTNSKNACMSKKCLCIKEGVYCNRSCRCKVCPNRPTKSDDSATEGASKRPVDLICRCGVSDPKDATVEKCKDKKGSRRTKCPCVRKGFGCSWQCKCKNCANILNTIDLSTIKPEVEEGAPTKRRRVNPINYKRSHGMESTWTPGYDIESCNWSLIESITVIVMQEMLTNNGVGGSAENIAMLYSHFVSSPIVTDMKLPIKGKRSAQIGAKLKELKGKQMVLFSDAYLT